MMRLRAPIVVIALAMGMGSACIDSTSPHFQRPAIAAGSAHTCRLATSGLVSCWGVNYRGQLGDGLIDAGSTTPVSVIGGLRFNTLAAGGAETCGIVESGDAYCWGMNSSGQIGNGSTTDSPAPATVSGGLHFITLSVSGTHVCGLTSAWVAYCWGENEGGRLGTGDTTDSATPIPVAGGLRFRVIAAGGGHTCAITTAGLAYC